ncbi:adenylate cyclase [Streptomyces sp. NPDC045251]|uniref:CYTH domain-containing protein n=1 Tax=unclassified Streptomyces TaxID=2593676 RepID=UPI00340C6A07
MPKEIERKFLVAANRVPSSGGTRIRQGYLAVAPDGGEVRLRQCGTAYTLTTKLGSGLVREEWEIELSTEDFRAMWPETEGARVVKTRHPVRLDGQGVHEAVLDVYEGALDGLRVLEVEFTSAEQALRFEPPAWFGMEVTGRSQYADRNLARTTAEEALLLIPSAPPLRFAPLS